MRYILHGGYGGHWDNAGNDITLFRRLIDAASAEDGKVMMSFCAYDAPERLSHLEQLKQTFRDLDPAIRLTIAGRSNFRDALSHHKVAFFQGGNPASQMEFMDSIDGQELIAGKTLVGGSSSGGMLLCRHGFSKSDHKVVTGKGLLDLAFIPHADAWPVNDFFPLLRKESPASVLLLNESQMIEIEG